MNPIFPLNEYIPDGEPHVFEDRIYLYGSHDRENGDRFCELDYVVYSAPVKDLTDWTYHGISYKKSQDPRSTEEKLVDYYAPDCVQGPDGKYYLYYVAMGPNTKNFGPMSVAVGDRPEGPFEYLSDIKYKDGTPVLKYLTNDPAVINDNGKVYLYYGWGLARDFRSKLLAPVYNMVQSKLFSRPVTEIKATKPSILSCACVELESDMCTVKEEPHSVLDSKTTADKHSALYHHAFYEAPSIRKFGEWYYLIYSSGENHELAYAMSKYPDRDFEYKGVLISNCDLGYKGNTKRLALAGTIHGSVEYINGAYYVFYHRCTNNTDFSRQACMEPIKMNEDGTFEQTEITTQGADEPLESKGVYSACLCCNLYHDKITSVQGNGHGQNQPNITHKDGERFITAITDETTIGFKYVNFKNPATLSITVRGVEGIFDVYAGEEKIGYVDVVHSQKWKEYNIELRSITKIAPLYFIYRGKGKVDFLEFKFE